MFMTTNGMQLELEMLTCRNGLPTARIDLGSKQLLLHSSYNPEQEALRQVEPLSLEEGDVVLIYGLGLGYHVKAILNKIGSRGQVVIFQQNTALAAKLANTGPAAEVLADPRVELVAEDNMQLLAAQLKYCMEIMLEVDGKFFLHRPSLEILPPEFERLRVALQDWEVARGTIQRFGSLLEENLRVNLPVCRELPAVSSFFGQFKDVPIIVVAAGPSLDNEFEHLRQVGNKALILAVGTSVAPLLRNGIEPHMIIVTDPQGEVFKQIEGLSLRVPLIVLPSVYPQVLQNYSGPRIVAWQKGINLSGQEPWASEDDLIETGGSVATTACDIAIRMGGWPVIFVGLDLGYPMGKNHAYGTTYWYRKIIDRHCLELPSNDGKTVLTVKNYNYMRRWLEGRIRREPAIEFINTSQQGAFIQGTRIMAFQECLHRWINRDRNVQSLIKQLLQPV